MAPLVLTLVLVPVWAYLAAVVVAAMWFARRPLEVSPALSAVSIPKPLHGAEPGLYENLRSFVDQDYPESQIVFGVRDRDDGALTAVRALITNRPERDIALVVEQSAAGSNLKVANLANMLPAARHDILVFADSDMRVDRRYLATVTAPLQDSATGVVTCLYKGIPTGGVWSRLGALHINFDFLPSALLGEALAAGGGCFGATVVIRREVLERIGGLASLRDELADDHRLGAAVRRLGLVTVLSRYLVDDSVSEPNFASLWRHELRWARTVRAMAPVGFAGSALTHTIVISLLVSATAGMSLISFVFLFLTCLLRWASAAALARILCLRGELPWSDENIVVRRRALGGIWPVDPPPAKELCQLSFQTVVRRRCFDAIASARYGETLE